MIRLAAAAARHHARLWATVGAAAALATALLVAGFAVGDGLRAALHERVVRQLGPVDIVVEGPDAGFTEELAVDVDGALGSDAVAVGLWHRAGVLSSPEGRARAVDVVAATERLSALAPHVTPLAPDEIRMDADLAGRLGVAPGDGVVLRIARPSALGRDVALERDDDRIVGMSLTVGPLMDGRWPTDLSIRANSGTPDVVFVQLDALQDRLGGVARIDQLLVSGAGADAVVDALSGHWRLADAGLSLADAGDGALLTTERVILEPHVAREAIEVDGAEPAIVWFSDRLSVGDRGSPYAFVGAVPVEGASAVAAMLPDDLPDDGIVLDAGVAEDLEAGVGDTVVLRYPVLGSHREVTYAEASFVVALVAALADGPADDSWAPPIEGLSGRETCASWDPGLPVDLTRIRDEDEAWWAAHGGTPKAWIRGDVGRRLWGDDHGDTTQVRWPGRAADDVGAALRGRLGIEAAGLRVLPVRDQLTAAAAPANDFGALFGGFQVVLLVAAMALVVLQTGFAITVRREELGTLRALGWPARRVGALVFVEAVVVVIVGTAVGVPCAWAVAAALDVGLAGAWSSATSGVRVASAIGPSSVAVGAGTAIALTAASVAWTLWRQLRLSARDLLTGVEVTPTVGAGRRALWVAVVALVVGIGLALAGPATRTPEAAGRFFGAGACLLVAGLAGMRARLLRSDRTPLGPTGLNRTPGRALAVAGLLALGAFLVVGVGLGAGRAPADGPDRSSGTGGFGLYGETTLEVAHRLDTEAGAMHLALPPDLLAAGDVVPLQVVGGDDASCLQLGRAQAPTLLGVDPQALAERGAFSWSTPPDGEGGWAALSRDLGPGRIAAVGDAPTLTWGLHAGIGDTITWVDESGETLEVEIVGILGSSILQGALIVDRAGLDAHFPSMAADRAFLVDVPPTRAAEVGAVLDRALVDLGARFVPTPERLHRFAAVEDTYIAIFRALGGLGLVLGGLGVGLVLARGVAERRGELAALRALGFTGAAVRRWLAVEHLAPVASGLGIGAGAAVVAAWPVAFAPDAEAPWGEVGLMLVATGLVAAASLWIVAGVVLRVAPLSELARTRR